MSLQESCSKTTIQKYIQDSNGLEYVVASTLPAAQLFTIIIIIIIIILSDIKLKGNVNPLT